MLVKVKLSRFMFNLLYNAHVLQEVILRDNFSCIFCSIMNTVVYFHFQFISFLISATRDGIPCYPDFQNLLDITLTTYKCNVLWTWKASNFHGWFHTNMVVSYGRTEFWTNHFYELWLTVSDQMSKSYLFTTTKATYRTKSVSQTIYKSSLTLYKIKILYRPCRKSWTAGSFLYIFLSRQSKW